MSFERQTALALRAGLVLGICAVAVELGKCWLEYRGFASAAEKASYAFAALTVTTILIGGGGGFLRPVFKNIYHTVSETNDLARESIARAWSNRLFLWIDKEGRDRDA